MVNANDMSKMKDSCKAFEKWFKCL